MVQNPITTTHIFPRHPTFVGDARKIEELSCTSSGLAPNFWGKICQIAQKFTERPISDGPAFFLLHASETPVEVYKKSVLRHLLDAAKACIPLLWKYPHPPTIDLWLRKVADVNKMEDLILTARYQRDRYSKTWTLWNLCAFSDEGRALLGNDTHA